jgi:hypothetical protein
MQALLNSIIDAELEASRLAKEAYDSAKEPAARLKVMARNLVKLAKVKKMSAPQAKNLWTKAFLQLTLIQFAKQAPDIQTAMYPLVTQQIDAAKRLKGAVKKIPAIRNVHIKQRAMEKAGALDKSGDLKTE